MRRLDVNATLSCVHRDKLGGARPAPPVRVVFRGRVAERPFFQRPRKPSCRPIPVHSNLTPSATVRHAPSPIARKDREASPWVRATTSIG
jgi:hypothetical protein